MNSNTYSRLFLNTSIFLLLLWGISSCTSTLYVAPKQVDCTGASSQKCYLIRSSAEGNWIMHYHEIQGLDYELGYSYKIKVKKENNKNVPMDGASFTYHVVEVLEKRDVTEDLALEDLLDTEWTLEYLSLDKMQYGVEDQVPTLKFENNGKASGYGGCNNFFSTFTVDGRTIQLGDIGSTKMMCEGSMELEQAYFQFLNLEMRAIFNDGKLVLSTDGGNRMILGRK